MKYIRKKSISKPILGSISDTLNITDKKTNTYSAKIIEELISLSGGGSGSSLPVGAGCDYFGTTPPEGFLFADGSAVSRTTYADLFAVIGTTYGAGDGSTTFNLPDKREAVTIMKGTTYTTLGQSVGGNTKTIAKANLPSYNLTVTDPGHTHSYNDYYATSSSKKTWDINKTASSVTSVSNTYTSRTSGSKTTGITVSSGGSGTAFNVMQKTLVCNYIIKAYSVAANSTATILAALEE